MTYIPPTAGSQYGAALYGDASSGASVTISATTTLGEDKFYGTLVVNDTINLYTSNFRVFCKTSCTVNATGYISPQAEATTPSTGSVGCGGARGAGGVFAHQDGYAGGNATVSLGGAGGVGGYATVSGGVGGAGGSATDPTEPNRFRVLPWAVLGKLFAGETLTSAFLSGGGGGGGGAWDFDGGDGFAGGHGGGVVILIAKSIVNNGSIHANGHAGSTCTGNGEGDGGGGGGGVVITVSRSFTGNAPTATGGSPGTGGSGEPAAGAAGTVIQITD